MDGGATFYYWVATAAAAAGTAIQVDAGIKDAEIRADQLKDEIQAAELAALDAENQRLIELQLANDEILVNAGNVDPYASLSLVASRKFNFQQLHEDVANIRLNLLQEKSGASKGISILNMNRKAMLNAGILQIGSQLASAQDIALTTFGRPDETSAITKKKKSGAPGTQGGFGQRTNG